MLTISPFWNGIIDGVIVGALLIWGIGQTQKFIENRNKSRYPFQISFDPKNKDELFWHTISVPSPESNDYISADDEYVQKYFVEIENRCDEQITSAECWLMNDKHKSQQLEFTRVKSKLRTFKKGDKDYVNIFNYNDFYEIRCHDADPEEYQFIRNYTIEIRSANAPTCAKKLTINVNKVPSVSLSD